MRQYAEGAQFVHGVVDRVGMAGFNKVWQSPLTLPRLAELADPAAWVARVHPARHGQRCRHVAERRRWPRSTPAVAAIRVAVRRCLADHLPRTQAPLSWWPALAALIRWRWRPRPRFVASRQPSRVGLVTVDHWLQAGSAERAGDGRRLGRPAAGSPRSSVATVDATGRPGGRRRRPAMRGTRPWPRRPGSRCRRVLLGHTRDDQAETVLLAWPAGPVRGAGRDAGGGAGRRGAVAAPAADAYREPDPGPACAEALLDPGRTRTTPTRRTPGPAPGAAAALVDDARPGRGRQPGPYRPSGRGGYRVSST